MSGSFDPRVGVINSRVNTVVGLKQYRQVKKVMEQFDSKMRQEMDKQIDQRVK